MTGRQDQNTGTRQVREGHRFDVDRLEAWLHAHADGFQGPLDVSQFKGGQSNPTYLLQAASGSYVLRRKPPGQLLKSAHAVDREFRVISALHASGFPVPRPYTLCEDAEIIGTMFYVMEFVDGRIFWELDLPGMEPAEREAIYDNVNETIARLHTIRETISNARFRAGRGNIAHRRPLRLPPWTSSLSGFRAIFRAMIR